MNCSRGVVISFRKITFIFLLLVSTTTYCQLPYTVPAYQFTKDSAVVFGTTNNYCGYPYQLKMNLYKPIGDANLHRPVIIFVHGGAFISSEDFNEPNMNAMAIQFARRGYVAASLDYREGVHLAAYGTGLPQTIGIWNLPGAVINWNAEARTFAADSAEPIRAIYRAQQDVKAAIRFLKARSTIDSTDICKVFLSGHSAGAIAVLTAAFLDRETDKPVVAANYSTLPNPKWVNRCEFVNPFNPNECLIIQPNGPAGRDDLAYQANNNPGDDYNAANSYLRPDLGSFDGDVNINGYDVKIAGVASMSGAIADTTILTGQSGPALFLYHQPADRVVSFGTSKPFSFYNDFLSPGPNARWPVMYGSSFIKNKLTASGYPAAISNWWYDNSANDPLALTSHDILPGTQTLADTIAKFFARVMDTSSINCLGVVPLTLQLNAEKISHAVKLKLQFVDYRYEPAQVIIQRSADGIVYNDMGRPVALQTLPGFFWDNTPLSQNFYRVKITHTGGRIQFSNTVQVAFAAEGYLLYPNPVKGSGFTIEYYNKRVSTAATFYIKNSSGLTMRSQHILLQPGQNNIPVDIQQLPRGMYYVQVVVKNDQAKQVVKFVRL